MKEVLDTIADRIFYIIELVCILSSLWLWQKEKKRADYWQKQARIYMPSYDKLNGKPYLPPIKEREEEWKR